MNSTTRHTATPAPFAALTPERIVAELNEQALRYGYGSDDRTAIFALNQTTGRVHATDSRDSARHANASADVAHRLLNYLEDENPDWICPGQFWRHVTDRFRGF